MSVTKFKYDKTKKHKSVRFGAIGSGAKTALCKLYNNTSDCFEMIDLEITKKNWKDVDCPVCKSLRRT